MPLDKPMKQKQPYPNGGERIDIEKLPRGKRRTVGVTRTVKNFVNPTRGRPPSSGVLG